MNKISAIIIDDEQISRNAVRSTVTSYCHDIEILDEADSVDTAVTKIQQLNPDLVFLDIEIKNGTGFDVLQQIETIRFNVIFITGFNHFAIKAFKFSAIDYILKPFDPLELVAAINKVRIEKERQSFSQKFKLLNENETATRKKIALPTLEGLSMVWVDEIVRCSADNSYTTFYLKNRTKLMVSKGIKEYDEMLSSFQFYRVHQSHLVNLNEVRKFLKDDGGILLMDDETRVPVARRRKEQVLELLTNL